MNTIATVILILFILIIFLFFAVRNANRQNLVPNGSGAHDIKERAGMGGETIMLFFMVYLITLCIFSFFSVKGQNLIPNGDFEQYITCPASTGQFYNVTGWMNPTGGSPDYFDSCNPGQVNVPNSIYGYQPAHSGGGFSGLFIYSGNSANTREYIEVQFTTPLIASQCYYFEMYVNLADNFKYFSDAIGAYFSDTLITGQPGYQVLLYTSQITNTTGNFDTISWRLVSGTYLANGGEEHILIGNFKDDSNTSFTFYNNAGTYNYAYVYIDDVSLSPCTGTEEILPSSGETNDQFTIYPNPVKDELKINAKNRMEEIKIYDVIGKKVFEQANFRSSVFNIQSLNSGIYFIEINNACLPDKQGKDIYRKKFLKE
jgi:hypothetical protein